MRVLGIECDGKCGVLLFDENNPSGLQVRFPEDSSKQDELVNYFKTPRLFSTAHDS